jgi:hypothetical protein
MITEGHTDDLYCDKHKEEMENKIQSASDFFFQEKYLDTPFVQIGIDFAKLHVEAALKAAVENAELDRDAGQDLNGISIDKDSVLNSYPLDNIK